MKTVKTGIMAGVLAVGIVAIASAQGWMGCCGGMQPADQRTGSSGIAASTNAVWVCPHHGANCLNHCGTQIAPANGNATPTGTVNQTGVYSGCRHWYRWVVPGHRGRCAWNGSNTGWGCGYSW